jgi:anti-sigma B factor antagonist
VLTQLLASCGPPVARVRIIGELDLSTRDDLSAFIGNLHRGGCTRLAVDATGVTFIDACSLAVLHSARIRLLEAGGTLDVVSASRSYRLAARLAGYDGLLPPDGPAPRPRVAQA